MVLAERGSQPARGSLAELGRPDARARRGRGADRRARARARLLRAARGGGRRRRRPRPASIRPAATSPRSTPSPSTRRRARDFDDAVSAAPDGRRHPRSGSTSPTSPRTCGPAAARRRGASAARPASTCPARSSRCCPGRSRGDACSLAPGVERLAVTVEIVLVGGRRAALGQLLPQPDPLRRAARLRPARRVFAGPRAAAGADRGAARSRPRAPPRRSPSAAPASALEVEQRPSPSSSSTPTAT